MKKYIRFDFNIKKKIFKKEIKRALIFARSPTIDRRSHTSRVTQRLLLTQSSSNFVQGQWHFRDCPYAFGHLSNPNADRHREWSRIHGWDLLPQEVTATPAIC